ncbi:MAG TPA: CBS domain-containing protein [Gaiellaceae bacterium]|jgi:CBS domain-containing protein
MATTINEVMTRDPRTLTPESTVGEAARFMRDDDIGSLPLVEGTKCIGTVTDRDIVVGVVAESLPLETPVREIAAKNLVTVDPHQPVDEAMRLMAEHQLRRLPVCDEDGRLVGIVAQADVARVASPEQTGETVAQISQS